MRLADKVAVITGGGSGIGKASALLFAEEGAKVVVASRNPQKGEKVVEEIKTNGGDAIYVQVDVANEKDVEKMVSAAVDKFGKLDIMFNVAGRPQESKPFDQITDEEWEGIMAVNVKGIFLTSKHALSELKKSQGVILNIGSVGGELPRPGSVCYAASKGAVINITRALAVELAKHKIRVNNINPGPTDTPMMFEFIPEFNDDIKSAIGSSTPLGSFVDPKDVAYAAVFLASSEASKITGSSLNVDSGLRIGRSAQ